MRINRISNSASLTTCTDTFHNTFHNILMRLWPTPSLINRHIPQYSWHIPQHSQQQLRWNVSFTDQPHQQLSITEEDTRIQFTERKPTYKLTTHPARHQLLIIHSVTKNDTDVGRYSFDVHRQIFITFGRNVADTHTHTHALI